MNIPFHQEQLAFMTHLATLRTALLDPLFYFLNYFDTVYFFYFLIPSLWFGLGYKWGLRIFYWFTLSSILNSSCKLLFGWPRPCTDLPEIGLLHLPSYGFPSGAAQTCLFLGGLLIYYWKTPIAKLIAAIYILLISFSRLYLGVHYPVDILGGWALGGSLLILFIQFEKKLETFLQKQELFAFFLSQALPLCLFMFRPQFSLITGSLMGVGLGTYFSLKHHFFLPPPHTVASRIFRASSALLLLFLLILAWPSYLPPFMKPLILGLFMSLAASPIIHFLERKWNKIVIKILFIFEIK